MIDHVTLHVKDYDETKKFYEEVLATVGIKLLVDYKEYKVVGFGKDSPELWLSVDESKIGGQPHVGLKVNNQEEVQAFYHKAISLGAKDNGAPGLRPEYGPTYYAAFVITPDGHNLEALIK